MWAEVIQHSSPELPGCQQGARRALEPLEAFRPASLAPIPDVALDLFLHYTPSNMEEMVSAPPNSAKAKGQTGILLSHHCPHSNRSTEPHGHSCPTFCFSYSCPIMAKSRGPSLSSTLASLPADISSSFSARSWEFVQACADMGGRPEQRQDLMSGSSSKSS